MPDRAQRQAAQHRIDVQPQDPLVERLRAGPVVLHAAPPLRVLLHRLPASTWVHVLPGDDRGRGLVKPSLGVDLAVEVPSMLSSRLVPVTRPPPTV